MKWTAELMYIARNDHGVIVGIQQEKPTDYTDNIKKAVETYCNASSNEQEIDKIKKVEQQLREYASLKHGKKAAR